MSSTSGPVSPTGVYPSPAAEMSPRGSESALARWPERPEFLTDTTRCPACFTVFSAPSFAPPNGSPGPVCGACGLDVSGPEAADVFAAGSAVIAAQTSRQQLLHRMRVGQAEREAARLAAAYPASSPGPGPDFGVQAPAAPAAPQYPAAYPAPLSAWYPPLPPASPGTSGASAPAGPRRSGIQILMLTVGVILVSIMAIFFVLLAYLIASLEVRSVLTGVASVAVLGVAWLLHRRRLSGTAQGIALLAVVLLLLDLWIIRANDLFGSGGVNGWLYSGIATGILAALLVVVFRALPLRSLSVSAVLLGPFAVFATTLGLLHNAASPIPSWAALTAVGAASVAWPLIRFGSVERGVVRTVGLAAAALAILPASLAFDRFDAGPVLSLGILAAVWFGHLAVSSPATVVDTPVDSTGASGAATSLDAPSVDRARNTGMHVLTALGLGFTVAAVGPALLFRLPEPTMWLWVPATVTMLGAVVLASLGRARVLADRATLFSLAATVPVAVASLAIAPAVLVALSHWVSAQNVQPFSLAIIDELPLVLMESRWTVPLALVLVAALMASVLGVARRLRTLGWAPTMLGAVGLLAICFALATPALTGVALLVVAVGGLLTTASPRVRPVYRLVSGITASLGLLGVFLVGLTNTVTFPFAVLATLAMLLFLRDILRRTVRPAVTSWLTPIVVATLAVIVLISVRVVPDWFQTVTGSTAAQAAPALLLSLCAIAIVAVLPLLIGVVTRVEAAALGAVAVVPLVMGLTELSARIPVDAVPFLIATGLTVAAGIFWQLVRSVSRWPERFVCAVSAPALAVLFAWVLAEHVDATRAPVVAAAAIVLLAGAAIVLFRPSASTPMPAPRVNSSQLARLLWDGALALSAVPLLVSAFSAANNGWLTLFLLAVASLIVATGEGGLVRGHTRRRHAAWAALPLAVASLWLALADNDVTVVEFYTLPVSVLLAGILAVILVRRAPSTDGSGRTVLLGAALAVALLPSAIAAHADEPLRGALVVLVSAALLVVAPFVPRAFRGTRVAAVIWLAGALTAALTVVVLAFRGNYDGWQNEAVAGALLVGGFLWLYRKREFRVLGTGAVASAPILLVLPVLASTLIDTVDLWRFLLALLFACTLFVAASRPDSTSSLVRWTALTSAILLATVAALTGAVDPFEWATVPVALALLSAGGIRLAHYPAARSWPELGIGLSLLLLPSLLADFGPNELWRVVALGVVALLVFGTGLALKLGAPTLIGAVVLVLHGLAQLWPWIAGLYGAIPWWLWAGIGGVILIFLAATYERRIRDLRATARSISSLR